MKLGNRVFKLENIDIKLEKFFFNYENADCGLENDVFMLAFGVFVVLLVC